MGTTYSITYGQGNQLLGMALKTKFPEKVGEKTFKGDTQSKISEWFRQLGKCLKKSSFRSEANWLFGKEEAWSKKELKISTVQANGAGGTTAQLSQEGSVEMQEAETTTLFMLKDPDLKIEVELNAQAVKGIYWLSYLWANPRSPVAETPGFLDEYVWPLVEMIGREGALKKDIGLVDVDADEPDDELEPGKILEMPKKPEEKIKEA